MIYVIGFSMYVMILVRLLMERRDRRKLIAKIRKTNGR